MSLSSKTELARALFRTPSPDSVTRISGTATADSSDGTVTVQLEDGDVIEVGTIGSVSAGDTVTIHVQRGEAQVIASEGWGDAMQAAVDEATAIAEATGQHFWHDSNGAHVTEITQEQWQQSQTGHNILVNSLGILLRKALNYIAAWTGSALSFYDGDGNAASNVTASFGSAGAQIGKVDESHLEMDYHSLRMIDKDGNEYFEVEDLRDQSGTATVVDTFTGDGSTTQFSLSYTATDTSYTVSVSDSSGGTATKTTTKVNFSTPPTDGSTITATYTTAFPLHAFTFGTRAAGTVGCSSSTLGWDNVASGHYSHAAGTLSKASGNVSHAEGYFVTASGYCSHAEGEYSTSSGKCSHAEGASSASGENSHAEGKSSSAQGDYSHAEGYGVNASGAYSHAQNRGTIAQGVSQTALGKYNVADSTSALIIGNGTSNARSNALTVDWSGNVEAAGGLSLYGGTAFEDMLVSDSFDKTIGSVSANGGTKELVYDVTKTGYKALAAVGFYLSGASRLHIYRMRLTAANEVTVNLVNKDTAATSATAKLYIDVLYVKTA